MNILITGVEGYIGSVLGPTLIKHGHRVVGIDTGFYRDAWLFNNSGDTFPECRHKDIRQVTTGDLQGFDAVVHLAELSNDPLGQIDPGVTYGTNHIGSVQLAMKCKAAGVRRFIYSSSCSVYGAGSDLPRTEEAETGPLTTYAKCKLLVERDVAAQADGSFCPVFLRNATAYGASPRMRFDLVLNNLSGLAWVTKEIRMVSDGTPWRPLIHVRDICGAVRCALTAPQEAVHNQVFNVGDDTQNYQVRDLAEIVAREFPGCSMSLGKSNGDNRSYRVSFQKIRDHLPTFRCRRDAVQGARELKEVFERIDMPREVFEARPYTRLEKIQYLLKTDQINAKLFWRDASHGIERGRPAAEDSAETAIRTCT